MLDILKSLPGYDFRVLYNGHRIEVQNLELLNLKTVGQFTIQLKLTQSEQARRKFSVTPVYTVNSRTKDIQPIEAYDDVFEFDVPILRANNGVAYTKNNSVRFIAYDEEAQMCEYVVAVFSQNGKHYFGMQRNWRERFCINSEGSPVIENVEWDQMTKFLISHMKIRPQGMAGELKQVPKPIPVLTDDKAVVKWFSLASGSGALITAQGLAKVHYLDICSNERKGPNFLRSGQIVKAKVIPANNARHKTEYQLLAKEVQVIP